MIPEEFDVLVQQQLDLCKNLLCSKSKEYDFGADRLHSFKVAANLENTTEAKALLGYLTKHIISLYDMISSEKYFTMDKWEEKITDTINYMLLLKAIVKEEESKRIKPVVEPIANTTDIPILETKAWPKVRINDAEN